MTVTALAARAKACGVRIDRVTLSQILHGHATRPSAVVAVGIERATKGEVPCASWLPEDDDGDGDEDESHVGVAALPATGTDGV